MAKEKKTGQLADGVAVKNFIRELLAGLEGFEEIAKKLEEEMVSELPLAPGKNALTRIPVWVSGVYGAGTFELSMEKKKERKGKISSILRFAFSYGSGGSNKLIVGVLSDLSWAAEWRSKPDAKIQDGDDRMKSKFDQLP